VLLRPRASWDMAVPAAAVAARNRGLVLGRAHALVLDEQMTAGQLDAAVEHQLAAAAAAAAATNETTSGRAARVTARTQAAQARHYRRQLAQRRAHRLFWFGVVDGFEELRTWFALLALRALGQLGAQAGCEQARPLGSTPEPAPPRDGGAGGGGGGGGGVCAGCVRAVLEPLWHAYTTLQQPAAAHHAPSLLAHAADHPLVPLACGASAQGRLVHP
jgi:hypothetical protein